MSTPFGSDLADRLSTPDGISKFADLSGKVIMDRLREIAWSSPLLNMRPISPDECQISENSDTFTKVEFMEPNSRALTVNFRSDSQVRIIHAPRAFMSFYTIASEVFQKREQELQIYRSIPVSQILEQNTLKDMQEIRDHGFISYAELAVQALQQEANGGSVTTLNASALQSATPPVEFSVVKGELARSSSVNNAFAHYIQRPDIVSLKKLLSSNRLEGAVMLLTAPDLDGVDAWTLEDNGDRVQSETVTEGFKGNKLLGLKIIKTIKTDILRPGNVWLFPAPHFLGRAYLLNKTKFYVDKRFNVISWQAWEDLGMLILNVAGPKKLELYSGDASANDADGIRADVSPKAERDLGAKNNRVDEGVRFPQVKAILRFWTLNQGRLRARYRALCRFGGESMPEPNLVIVNATTQASTKGLRLRSKFREKVLLFQVGGTAVRLLPDRPLTVPLSWVEAHRDRLIELKDAGAIFLFTVDRQPVVLPATGPIDLPAPVPRRNPEIAPLPGELPSELRGEALFTGELNPGKTRKDAEGWTKVSPLERDNPVSLLEVSSTPDTAFPSPLPEEKKKRTPPFIEERDLLGDLMADAGPPAYVQDLPADMRAPDPRDEGAGEPLSTEPAPSPQDFRRNRRRRG